MNITGYYKEYYLNNKYMGRVDCEKDRDTIGYAGKKNHVADNLIRFKNKKINKGQEYTTILYPYNAGKQ